MAEKNLGFKDNKYLCSTSKLDLRCFSGGLGFGDIPAVHFCNDLWCFSWKYMWCQEFKQDLKFKLGSWLIYLHAKPVVYLIYYLSSPRFRFIFVLGLHPKAQWLLLALRLKISPSRLADNMGDPCLFQVSHLQDKCTTVVLLLLPRFVF